MMRTNDKGDAMQYLLLICNDESALASLSPEERSAMMAEYELFGNAMGSRGVLRGGERLRPAVTLLLSARIWTKRSKLRRRSPELATGRSR
jgi:hypothetical protein